MKVGAGLLDLCFLCHFSGLLPAFFCMFRFYDTSLCFLMMIRFNDAFCFFIGQNFFKSAQRTGRVVARYVPPILQVDFKKLAVIHTVYTVLVCTSSSSKVLLYAIDELLL